MLKHTTIISLSKNTKELRGDILNWEEIPGNVKELFNSGSHYTHNGQELLVYNGRQIISSSTIDRDFYDNLTIHDCWTKEGNIW